jgi:NADPH2 dehydrogenase
MSLLNSPISVGNIEIKNRLVMPPMATTKADEKGNVTEKLCEYYSEKSKGGCIGLIITEHSFVSPEGKANKGQISISKDTDIEGLKKIVTAIHKNDTKVFAQINHAGGATKKEITGHALLSASSIKIPRPFISDILPKEMTLNDIKKVIDDFAKAALRAKKAGYDGIEIHSAHGYLLSQFFSPLTNKREDKYTGATLQGRIQLHLEIIEAIRKVVGTTYPLALRLGACDYIEGGITIRDSIYACKEFEKAGVDLLDISGGFSSYINPVIKDQGYFSELSEEIKKAVDIPVILTGGILEASVAESLLKTRKADMIGVGRAILKNSEWAEMAIHSLE